MSVQKLNEKLFETLEALDKGEIDVKKAEGIVNIANSINNNHKLMLQAAKLSKNTGIASQVIGINTIKHIDADDTYDAKNQFAKSIGYRSFGEAIAKVGRQAFDEQFQNENNI